MLAICECGTRLRSRKAIIRHVALHGITCDFEFTHHTKNKQLLVYCCNKPYHNIRTFLQHIRKTHKLNIYYKKGLVKE